VVEPVGVGNIPTKPTWEPLLLSASRLALVPWREAPVAATKFPVRLKNTVLEADVNDMMEISLKFEDFDASVTAVRGHVRLYAPIGVQEAAVDATAVPAQLLPPKEHCTDTHDPWNLQSLPSDLHEIEQ